MATFSSMINYKNQTRYVYKYKSGNICKVLLQLIYFVKKYVIGFLALSFFSTRRTLPRETLEIQK